MTWSPKYQALLDHMADVIVAGSGLSDKGETQAVAMICDLTCNVLEKLFPDENDRLAALDVFLIRLGNVMEGRKGKAQ